jgi:hypothetical protein
MSTGMYYKIHLLEIMRLQVPSILSILLAPNPSLACECAPPSRTGRGHTRLRVRGWGSPNSDDWRKSLALCLLRD